MMEWFVRAFLKGGLVALGLGVSLGLGMAAHPQWIVYRPAHVHLNLLGFVTMMIYGVAYHVIPRFTGAPLFSRRLAGAHFWAAAAGLAAMVAGFMLLPHFPREGRAVLVAGGFLSAAAAYLFIVNIWRTLNAAAVPEVLGEIHGRHAALTEHALDAVAAGEGAFQRRMDGGHVKR